MDKLWVGAVTMNLQEHFGFVTRTISSYSTYSKTKDLWSISVPHLKAVLQGLQVELPPERASLDDVLEEGVCRGLWQMDFDHETREDIVVSR